MPAQQERLSTATWSVLAEKGLRGLTVRAVAERAECTTGLVMHAFPDKRALLRHARELLHQRTAQRADQAEQTAPDAGSRLRAVLLQAACLTPDKQDEARVWLAYTAACLDDSELADLHIRHNRAFLRRIARLVADAHGGMSRPAAARVAVSLVALVEGLSTLAALDPRSYSAAAQRQAIDSALAGVIGQQPVPRLPG